MFRIFSDSDKEFLRTIDCLNITAELYARKLISSGYDEDFRLICKGALWMFFIIALQIYLTFNAYYISIREFALFAENIKNFALFVSILITEYVIFYTFFVKDRTSIWETIEYFHNMCIPPAVLYLAVLIWSFV